MTGMEIGEKLEELSGRQGQAADALYLLLDGLEREGQMVTKGPLAAEDFSERLRMYMGALHLIADNTSPEPVISVKSPSGTIRYIERCEYESLLKSIDNYIEMQLSFLFRKPADGAKEYWG